MIKYADIIVDLQHGDTGKGKVAHNLSDQFIKHIYDSIDAPLYKVTFSRSAQTI